MTGVQTCAIPISASQLWVSYHKGPLGGRGAKPRPGDRIADLACTRADGAVTRLHRELGGRWALLTPGLPSPAIEAARQHLGDFVTPLDYDGDEAILIRPDAHLAWRGCPGDASAVHRWLTAALTSGSTP